MLKQKSMKKRLPYWVAVWIYKFYLDCDEEYPELEIDFDAVARLDAPVGVPEAEEADEDAELLDELCDVFVELDFEAVKVDVVVVAVVDDVVEVWLSEERERVSLIVTLLSGT